MSDPAPLTLADVRDTDCVRSWAPLRLGRIPGKYVSGRDAVIRRVLYAWLLVRGSVIYDLSFGEGLLTLQGSTLSPAQVLGARRRLEAAAEREDFVVSAPCTVALVGVELQVAARVTLDDAGTARTYPLELALSSVGAALRALGA